MKTAKPDNLLTDQERRDRAHLEFEFRHFGTLIDRSNQTRGALLLELRDRRLYRNTHATFADYCKQELNVTHRHANRLIAQAEHAAEMGPIGPISNPECHPPPESQTRPLSQLRPEARAETWADATADAAAETPGGKVKARHVKAAVDRVIAADPTTRARPPRKPAAARAAEPPAERDAYGCRILPEVKGDPYWSGRAREERAKDYRLQLGDLRKQYRKYKEFRPLLPALDAFLADKPFAVIPIDPTEAADVLARHFTADQLATLARALFASENRPGDDPGE